MEVLFQPSFIGKEASGSTTRRGYPQELFANVILSGGTAIFQGVIERMTKELTALALFTMKIKVVAPTWYGLEDLSCLPLDFIRANVSFFFFGTAALPSHRDHPSMCQNKIESIANGRRRRTKGLRTETRRSTRRSTAQRKAVASDADVQQGQD